MAAALGYSHVAIIQWAGVPATSAGHRMYAFSDCSLRFQTSSFVTSPKSLQFSKKRAEKSLRGSRRSFSTSVSVTALSSEFVEQETAKFREDLLKSQGADENSAKIADVCTEVMKEYFATYSGVFENEPFAKMKEALDSAGLPANKVLLATIGWTRANLYTDWKRFSAK